MCTSPYIFDMDTTPGCARLSGCWALTQVLYTSRPCSEGWYCTYPPLKAISRVVRPFSHHLAATVAIYAPPLFDHSQWHKWQVSAEASLYLCERTMAYPLARCLYECFVSVSVSWRNESSFPFRIITRV